ncbi:Hypothetical protein PHPALM_1705 [Phytophthora palmivora]|uniref:PiggyBac transposable element-derived protein domain-containing protein n=1 Tax=Phytophthora palmivora TaxID=4796 RepID=A0A2P4YRK2_9STRA|nr:Hypothetical protein PHPALM_1705 [Phytophthora palmivora]
MVEIRKPDISNQEVAAEVLEGHQDYAGEEDYSFASESGDALDEEILIARERRRAMKRLAKDRLRTSIESATRLENYNAELGYPGARRDAGVSRRWGGAAKNAGGWLGNVVLDRAESPLQLLLFFMPARLWHRITTESNRYYYQNLNGRVDRMYEAQLKRGESLTREEVLLRETKRHKKIKVQDFLHCIGLLIAGMLCSHTRRFSDHWAKAGVDAVPKGTFGQFMSKAQWENHAEPAFQ